MDLQSGYVHLKMMCTQVDWGSAVEWEVFSNLGGGKAQEGEEEVHHYSLQVL